MTEAKERPVDHEILLSDLDLVVGDIVSIDLDNFKECFFRIHSYDPNGCDELSSRKDRGHSAKKRPSIRVEQVLSLSGQLCYAIRKAADSRALVRLEPCPSWRDQPIRKVSLIQILQLRDQLDRLARSGEVL